MAGYSGTPLSKKLGLKADARFAVANEPRGFQAALGDVPEGVERVRAGPIDVAVLFVMSLRELERGFAALQRALADAGGLWVAWPKQSSGVATDLSEGVVRAHGLAQGLVDNKVCAIDETWSGLRFVRRLADRAQRAGETRAKKPASAAKPRRRQTVSTRRSSTTKEGSKT